MELNEAIYIVSYKLGLKNGQAALDDKLLNAEIVHKAIEDKAASSEQKIDLKAYMTATKMLKSHRTQVFADTNKVFLDNNLKCDDVQVTASGLQYKILANGNGATPSLADTITVNYQGELIDGTVFESSIARGTSATFSVKKVIQGWKEGLQLMQVGAKYQFFVPQELAYGDRGYDSKVPPFATLIFEVELLSIE